MFNNATVPVAFGKVIVLSEPEASAAVSIISLASAVEPSNVIFPLASVMELAPSAAPDINVADAKDVIPAIVPAVAPRETLVLPRVTAELARLLLAIEDAVVNIVPVSFGNVRVLSDPVAFAAVSIVSLPSALDPSKVIFPLANVIAFAASATPDIKVPEAKEVNPAIVPSVAPRETAELPIVTAELAS